MSPAEDADTPREPLAAPAVPTIPKRASRTRSAAEVSAIMRRVHGKDTAPELVLRRALWAQGLRYQVAPATLPGKPDIVFTARKLAIFIDGDFWHGNQWRVRKRARLEEQFERAAAPSRDYWLHKIRRNMRRDCQVTADLLATGWTVLRLWESDIRRDLPACLARITDALAHQSAVAPATATQPTPDLATPYAALAGRACLEFFAGIGLMRLGLERAGWSVIFANDYDPQKAAMYTAHFGPAATHLRQDDIHHLSAASIPTAALATASFPCNDLSLAGARSGLTGKQSSAFWGFVRILRDLGVRRPPLLLLENVIGFLSSHVGADLESALLALNALDYSVDLLIVNAIHFTPQSRPRLFIVATYEPASTIPPSLLPPNHLDPTMPATLISDARPPALATFIAAHPAIRWRLRPLPPLPQTTRTLTDLLDDLPPDAPDWWSADRAQRLLDQMRPAHRARAERMIAAPIVTYGAIFRRTRDGAPRAELRADDRAGCLRTPRGGSARQIILKAGGGAYQARLLTPREAARLMGADDYILSGSASQGLFGFGDAVCVPVIEWLAQYYLNPLVNELLRGRPLRLAPTPPAGPFSESQ